MKILNFFVKNRLNCYGCIFWFYIRGWIYGFVLNKVYLVICDENINCVIKWYLVIDYDSLKNV